ncbi:MAG: uL30 family ribosomal protein [Candidatus Woesearchaeota archaeon]
MSKLAVILIRGLVGTNHDVRETLEYLYLKKKHACSIVEDTPSFRGMLKKVTDFVAYGELNEEVEKLLIEKRQVKRADGTAKKFFSLAPPKGGFERKGIKKPFVVGGALGYRGDNINELIKKMI